MRVTIVAMSPSHYVLTGRCPSSRVCPRQRCPAEAHATARGEERLAQSSFPRSAASAPRSGRPQARSAGVSRFEPRGHWQIRPMLPAVPRLASCLPNPSPRFGFVEGGASLGVIRGTMRQFRLDSKHGRAGAQGGTHGCHLLKNLARCWHGSRLPRVADYPLLKR
jgi:hypothetical protein